MQRRQDELEAFKCRIDLREYAAGLGYELDHKASSRNSASMKHPDGDKIIIGVGHDQHWLYFSVRDPADNGSIIDFVQRRRGGSIGDVRKELRPWLDVRPAALPSGRASTHPLLPGQAQAFGQKLEPVTPDVMAVRARYEAAERLEGAAGYHPYLCEQRALHASLLASKRFFDRIRIDERGNALFPHWNLEGLCGFEIKNADFTGFAPGGQKGLWGSRNNETDQRLVIAETAVDALSYAALFSRDRSRFVSTAGQMNPSQPALLNQAMRKMPTGSTIVAAVDHDAGGDAMVRAIEPIYAHVRDVLHREDLTFEVHQPETPGRDWNDVLRSTGAGQPGPRPA